MCAKEDGLKAKRQPGAYRRQRTLNEVATDDSDTASIDTVCEECFTFLKALAKDFKDVQEKYIVLDNHASIIETRWGYTLKLCAGCMMS